MPHIKIVKRWLEERKNELIEWPGNSPDLNIIENVWQLLKRKLNRMQIRSKNQLLVASISTWEQVATKEFIWSLIESIPTRIESVIKNHGCYCDY